MDAPPDTDDETGCGACLTSIPPGPTLSKGGRGGRVGRATTVDSSGRACYEDCTFVSRGAGDGGSTGDRSRVARPGDRRGRSLQVAPGRRCPGSGRGPSGGGQTRGGSASGQTPAGLRPCRRVGLQRGGDRDITRDRHRRGAHRRDRNNPQVTSSGGVVGGNPWGGPQNNPRRP